MRKLDEVAVVKDHGELAQRSSEMSQLLLQSLKRATIFRPLRHSSIARGGGARRSNKVSKCWSKRGRRTVSRTVSGADDHDNDDDDDSARTDTTAYERRRDEW